ncbi:ABC-type transport auxiliary lipoprotein family protein [Ectopseudomonas mendocina]|uniref:ABC-type transport auxiliary lipoprotein family protein n=1 Tax=Ectopseudomonas mendocina TaxID=300 RepID=A0ABZ2RF27_ECTME
MMALRVSGVLLSGLLVLGGCMHSPPVSLYQLDGGAFTAPSTEKGLAILLGPVSVADYLQRDTLLQRQTDGTLSEAPNARWAGSLAADIDQQLLRQIAARLDTQRVVLAPATAGFVPDARVSLTIARLDSGPERPAVLEGQWRLSGADGKLLDSRLISLEEGHDGSVGDQVRAQSELLQQLVEQIAVAVKSNKQAEPVQVTRRPRPKPAVVKPVEPPVTTPSIPMAEPIRESEVFRF